MASRDARRFVVGFGVAVVAWFVVLYPNISALPLPSAVVAAYQGILPTYLYAFQFPVSTVTRNTDTPLFTPMLAILLLALTVDLPGGRLLGVGVEAGAGRQAAPTRRSSDGCGRPGPDRRRLRHRRAEVLGQLSRSRRAGGSRSRSSRRPWPVTRGQLNCSARSRPAALIAARSSGSSSSRAMACASSLGSCGGTSRPSRPRRTTPL